ncbi:hypothetical protein OCS_01839 [Ophiocordyceps sinensis CO18]|uniref:Uncharacterized protein n=1 Tax=Ophiocordyceps sinensis (strain Co18 / CGMCC 3.14243) TaxID=911162 RepID=T5AAE9_OPHSC|nr:hypothetical protein OCS_01839 [Ophiocordyceps sinensis CO18]
MSVEHTRNEVAAEHVPPFPAYVALQNIEFHHDQSVPRHRGARESQPVFPDAHNRLPVLDFKPLTLRFWFLCVVLTWNLFVTAVLVVLLSSPVFPLTNIWMYFVVQVLPTAVGTVTTTFLRCIVLNLNRLTPFIRCAGGDSTTSADKLGCTAGGRILRWFFPYFSYRDAFATRSGLLLGSSLVEFIALFLLGIKAALLNTAGLRHVQANGWAALFLLVVYVMLDVHTVWVMCYMRNRTTGLRWDPVSIADHLALFRGAGFLDEFAGACIASPSSMKARLRNLRLRLGYWRTGTKLWHGFDATATSRKHASQTGSENAAPMERAWSSCPGVDVTDQAVLVSMEQLSVRRYAATGVFLHPMVRTVFAVGAVLLAAGHIAVLVLRKSDQVIVTTTMSTIAAAFAFQFGPVFLLGLFTWFWDGIGLSMAHTQPFVALRHDATADQSLLLNYTCLPRPVAIFTALTNGHFKLGLTSAVGYIQRLLPIIAGATVLINDEGDVRTVQVSVGRFYVVILWLSVYAVLISWDVMTEGYERCLPHAYGSIADLLSWTYASGLLRDDNLSSDKQGKLAGNPLEVKITDAAEAETAANNHMRGVMRDQGEEWYMKARLRLVGKRYNFGLTPVHANADLHTIGIGVVDENSRVVDIPVARPLGLLRRRREGAGDNAESGKYSIAGAGWALGRRRKA